MTAELRWWWLTVAVLAVSVGETSSWAAALRGWPLLHAPTVAAALVVWVAAGPRLLGWRLDGDGGC